MAIGFRAANSNAADSSTASVTLPSGTADGDCLVMMVTVYSTSVTWTDPSGWTNLAGTNTYITHFNNSRSKLYIKIASSESNPSIALSDIRRWSCVIAGYTGVDQTTPASTTENTGWSKNIASGTGAVTTTALTGGSGQWLVSIVGASDNATNNFTNTRTERADVASPLVASACSISSLADSNGSVSGSVTTTFTPGSTGLQSRAAMSILLNQATAAASPAAATTTAAVSANQAAPRVSTGMYSIG